eukprot:CAMPEP_0178452064 /NCGR_PEP_ID=MMETSP0689_2-20121128/44033_1 /TAXON_ID=160604 /ORGANISM="Amphidinium massartii, Strain CS-259" /LENGTH=90 /DNA_ID=CAMNT_0020077721 /DNA_START=183 /DNA_END=455 /DNA_ORIENTATION=-
MSAFVGHAQQPRLRSQAVSRSVAREAVFGGAKVDLIQPDEEPEPPTYLFGFNTFAENFNGRVAMLGFFGLLLVEGVLDKTLFKIIEELGF